MNYKIKHNRDLTGNLSSSGGGLGCGSICGVGNRIEKQIERGLKNGFLLKRWKEKQEAKKKPSPYMIQRRIETINNFKNRLKERFKLNIESTNISDILDNIYDKRKTQAIN